MSNKEFKKFEERRIQISKINILLVCYSFMQGDKYKNIKKSLSQGWTDIYLEYLSQVWSKIYIEYMSQVWSKIYLEYMSQDWT